MIFLTSCLLIPESSKSLSCLSVAAFHLGALINLSMDTKSQNLCLRSACLKPYINWFCHFYPQRFVHAKMYKELGRVQPVTYLYSTLIFLYFLYTHVFLHGTFLFIFYICTFTCYPQPIFTPINVNFFPALLLKVNDLMLYTIPILL